jgi:hypothetical protein
MDAVSVRKAKNIAREVERKRTNRITLRLASSIGLPPFPANGSMSNINTKSQYLFRINPGKWGINSVNEKKNIIC